MGQPPKTRPMPPPTPARPMLTFGLDANVSSQIFAEEESPTSSCRSYHQGSVGTEQGFDDFGRAYAAGRRCTSRWTGLLIQRLVRHQRGSVGREKLLANQEVFIWRPCKML